MKKLKIGSILFILLIISGNTYAITAADIINWGKMKKKFLKVNSGAGSPDCAGIACQQSQSLKAVLAGNTLTLTVDAPDPYNGLFLNYIPENKCTWLDLYDAHVRGKDIVVSGQFSGCIFAKCTSTDGVQYVSHIYKGKYKELVSVSKSLVKMPDGSIFIQYNKTYKDNEISSNPSEQARALETAVRAANNSSLGFKTKGRFDKHIKNKIDAAGYVLGIYYDDYAKWFWMWIVIDRKNNSVVEFTDITDDSKWEPIIETN